MNKKNFLLILKVVAVLFLSLVLGIWVLVPIIFIAYRKRAKAKKRLKEAKKVILGLGDFYEQGILEKDVLNKEYKEYCVREDNSVPYALCKKYGMELPDIVIFYFNPQTTSYIPEEKRSKCYADVLEFLCGLKTGNKQVVGVCPDVECVKKDTENLLKQMLLSSGIVIYYGEIDRTIEEVNAKEKTKIVFGSNCMETECAVKHAYILKRLHFINELQDSTQKFYNIIKLVEYIFQYRGLYAMSFSEYCREGIELSFSIGYWNNMQLQLENEKRWYSNQELLDAMKVAYAALGKKIPNNSKFSYMNVCETLVMLRNKFVGHGTIAYAVSKEMTHAVSVLAWCVIEAYVSGDEELVPHVTRVCKEYAEYKDIPCMLVEKGKPLLLTFFMLEENNLVVDYMDFESGKITSYGKMQRQSLAMNKEATNEQW